MKDKEARIKYLENLAKSFKEKGLEKQNSMFKHDPEMKGKKVYHGTNKPFDPKDILPSDNGLMGHGTYLTDDPNVAKSYARNLHNWQPNPAKRSKDYPTKTPQIKTFDLPDDVKLLDMESAIGEKERAIFNKHMKSFVSERNESLYFVPKGAKGSEAMYRLQDVIEKANTIDYDGSEIMADLAYDLKQQLGYDGLSHKGGVATNNKLHNVAVMFDPEYEGTRIKPSKANLHFTTPEGTVIPPKIKPDSLTDIRSKYLKKIGKAGGKALKALPIVGPAIGIASAIYSGDSQAMSEEAVDLIDPSGTLTPAPLGYSELPDDEMIKRKKYNDIINRTNK